MAHRYGTGEYFPNNFIAMKHFCFLGLFRGFQVQLGPQTYGLKIIIFTKVINEITQVHLV
jgi:hypothetical protein